MRPSKTGRNSVSRHDDIEGMRRPAALDYQANRGVGTAARRPGFRRKAAGSSLLEAKCCRSTALNNTRRGDDLAQINDCKERYRGTAERMLASATGSDRSIGAFPSRFAGAMPTRRYHGRRTAAISRVREQFAGSAVAVLNLTNRRDDTCRSRRPMK